MRVIYEIAEEFNSTIGAVGGHPAGIFQRCVPTINQIVATVDNVDLSWFIFQPQRMLLFDGKFEAGQEAPAKIGDWEATPFKGFVFSLNVPSKEFTLIFLEQIEGSWQYMGPLEISTMLLPNGSRSWQCDAIAHWAGPKFNPPLPIHTGPPKPGLRALRLYFIPNTDTVIPD